MACRDEGAGSFYRNKEIEKLNQATIMLAQMLCATCKNLESANQLHLLNQETSKWWERHKIEDENQAKLDKDILDALHHEANTINEALAKLTPDEKKLLNISY